MGFLTDLGNIFHSIGGFFSGGDNNNNQPQNNNQNQISVAPQQNNNRPAPQIIQPSQNNTQQPQQPNLINLQQPLQKANPAAAPPPPQINPNGPGAFNVNDLVNGTLAKAPMPAAPAVSAAPAAPGPSVASRVGGFLGNLAKGVGGAFVNTGEDVSNAIGNAEVGGAHMLGLAPNVKTETNQQQFGDINKSVGLPTISNTPAHFLENAGQVGLTVLAPETEGAIAAGTDAVLPEATNAAGQIISKLAPKVLTGVTTGGAFGGLNAASSGQNVVQGIEHGAEIGGVGGGILGGVPLVKAGLSDIPTAGDTAAIAPDEIAVGVKSANATPTADAVEQLQTKAAEGAPAGQDNLQPAQTPAGTNPTVPVQATSPSGQLQETAQPTSQPGTTPQPAAVVQPAEAKPLENSSSPNNVAQGEPNVNPQAPNAPNVRATLSKQIDDLVPSKGPTQPAHAVISNPELTAAAQKWADASTPQDIVSEYANQPKLGGASDMARANVSLHKLVEEAQNTGVKPEDVANPINKAIDNIVNALAEHSSNAGRSQNYLQEIYGNLPMQAKIPIIIRNIDNARALSGQTLLKDSLPLQSEVQAKLTNLLTTGENLGKARNATIDAVNTARENLLEQQKADPNFQPSKQEAAQLVQQGRDAQVSIKQANNALEKNQGDLAKYVSETSGKPQNTLGSIQGIKNVGFGKAALNTVTNTGKGLAELQKSLMLASISGPLNDSTLSGMNAARELMNMTANAAIGKGLNAVRSATGQTPGKYVSQLPSIRTLFRGSNLAKTGGEMKGNLYTPDALSTLTKTTGDGRTGLLQKADNGMLTKFNARVHATREAATNLTAGMQDVKVQQLANQEAKQAGLTGDAAKAYTSLRTATPTQTMTDQGTKLREEVNNMNDNPLSKALGSKGGGVLGGVSKIPGAGPLIQNLFQPFSQWVGAQGWNGITDQNIAANVAKATVAATKGDAQGVVNNISKLTVNAGGGITAGYALAHSGLLTTNHGTSSSANDGLYLHVGNQYIPVTFFGGAAPSLVMGYSAYTGMHSNPQGSMTSHIFNIAQNTLDTTAKAYAGGTPIGGTNSLFGPYGVATQAGQVLHPTAGTHTTWGDVGSNLGTQEASMMIPGATSNVNALINQFGGDPTHTAPQTNIKSLNPTTGNMVANPIASNNAYLESRIPILSQGMPRNLTKAAPTFASEYTRGSNTTQTQVDTAKATAAQNASISSQAAQDYKDGVPVYTKTGEVSAKTAALPKGYNFDNTLNTAIQTGNYDNAIKGLQGELKAMNTPGPDHIPPSAKQAVQDHINQLQVFKNQGVDAKFADTYSTTTNTEWRAMGNPSSSSYNPAMYQKLYTLDQALTDKGISGGSITAAGKGDTPKFSLPTTGSGSASSAASKAAAYVKSNTIGTLLQPQRESFVNNLLQPAQTLNLPEAKLTKPGTLIAPHKISVGTPKA